MIFAHFSSFGSGIITCTLLSHLQSHKRGFATLDDI